MSFPKKVCIRLLIITDKDMTIPILYCLILKDIHEFYFKIISLIDYDFAFEFTYY